MINLIKKLCVQFKANKTYFFEKGLFENLHKRGLLRLSCEAVPQFCTSGGKHFCPFAEAFLGNCRLIIVLQRIAGGKVSQVFWS